MSSLPTTSKGAATRELIVDRAYAIACRDGLEGLSIGELAQAVGMSKSGVFAHFGSREGLQLAVLESAARRFGEAVLIPAVRAPRGLARVRAMGQGWFDWVRDNRQGCLIHGAIGEFDSRPGPLHDAVVALMQRWRDATSRAINMAVETGELRSDTDAAQMSFEIFGIALALHTDIRLFEPEVARAHADRALERLLASQTP